MKESLGKHLFRDTEKSGQNWIMRFWHNGERVIKSTGTDDPKKAERALAKERGKAEYQGSGYVGPQENRIRFDDLAQLIERDYRMRDRRSLGKAVIRADGTTEYAGVLKVRFRHLRPFFEKYAAVDVTPALLDEYRDRRLSEFRMVAAARKGDKPTQKFTAKASIDLEIACLKTMFRLAVKKGLLSRMPAFPTPLLRPNENARQGFFEPAAFEAARDLMAEDLRDPLNFLYLSGWRPEEMRSLEWPDVNLAERGITLRREKSKNGEPRFLSLDDPELMAVMLRAKAHRRLDCRLVFHREGRKLTPSMFSKQWKKATAAAGIPGKVIYDTRRTVTRDLIRSGVPQTVAMKQTGHRTISTFQRYNITDERDQRAAVITRRAYLDALPRDPAKVVAIENARGQLALKSIG